MIEKTKQTFVLLVLVYCVFVNASFNLWMSKGAHEVFALVVKFLGEDWVLKCIIMACLKHLIFKVNIIKKFARIFKGIWIDKKILIYVKDKRSKYLNTMIIT